VRHPIAEEGRTDRQSLPTSVVIPLHIQRGDPPLICVHPIADALQALEPQRTARVSIEACIVAEGGHACKGGSRRPE
jgi:hypothetical protein